MKWVFPCHFYESLTCSYFIGCFVRVQSIKKVFPKRSSTYEPPDGFASNGFVAEAVYSTSLEEVNPQTNQGLVNLLLNV